MNGEIRKNDDLASDDDNKDKLFQELTDELEYAFEGFPISEKNLITTIEATGYKIRSKYIRQKCFAASCFLIFSEFALILGSLRKLR